ncbi:MAG: hypothetical protein IPM79_10060 [Polyangiaceae bacterium]|jgi:hypothetical protein|nr:hypothetical protein [Polyangiaceae bacterium]MBK8937966.1 hypothetical protein [Polyangiaceae bacterium]
MALPLRADDLWPLVLKLPHDEQVRLAKLALRAASGGDDARAYVAAPVAPGELDAEEDSLAWDAEGWDEPHAQG